MKPLVLALALSLSLSLSLAACGKKGDLEAPAGADPRKSEIDMQKDRKN